MSVVQQHTESLNNSPYKVLFVMQPHFSLLAFTAAADALTTANLVIGGEPKFEFKTLSVSGGQVISDLGIPISSDHSISEFLVEGHAHESSFTDHDLDLLIVCGGYRCTLDEDKRLTSLLKAADRSAIILGGLWNGIMAVAHADLMKGYSAAVHPDNHAAAKRRFPSMLVRQDTVVIDRKRVSAAGPNSAFDLMLLLIQRYDKIETVQAIREILRADAGAPDNVEAALQKDDERRFPPSLRNALQLMRSNLDNPVSKHTLAQHMNVSTRAMERMFQRYLNTSPARHYMQLRLHSAYEMLRHTDQSIGEVSDACGFVSSAHFSRTFSQRYGIAPSSLRKSVSRVFDV